jgi:6-phosphogluconolactonase
LTESIRFTIGSYTRPSPWAAAPNGHGPGISTIELDTASGSMSILGQTDVDNPAFIVSSAAAGRIWTTTELEHGGELVSFSVEGDGGLARRRAQTTGANSPCQITIDLVHGLAFIAHYQGGKFSMIALDDGDPYALVSVVSMPDVIDGEDRSEARPRPHSSVVIDDHIVVVDCGRDAVLLYRIDGRGVDAALELVASLALPAETGPRHIAHDAARGVLYISNQNSAGVSVVAVSTTGNSPRLSLVQIQHSLGLGRTKGLPSEIAMHPRLPIVYMANRRDDSISIFDIVSEDGTLAPRGAIDTGGEWPRHFLITKDCDFLLVANQNSDRVVSFHIDERGGLRRTGHELAIGTPTMVRQW